MYSSIQSPATSVPIYSSVYAPTTSPSILLSTHSSVSLVTHTPPYPATHLLTSHSPTNSPVLLSTSLSLCLLTYQSSYLFTHSASQPFIRPPYSPSHPSTESPSTYLSTRHPSINPCSFINTHTPAFSSIRLSTHVPIHPLPNFYSLIYPSTHLSTPASIGQPTHPFTQSPVLSICPLAIQLSTYSFTDPSPFVCLFIQSATYLPVCLLYTHFISINLLIYPSTHYYISYLLSLIYHVVFQFGLTNIY